MLYADEINHTNRNWHGFQSILTGTTGHSLNTFLTVQPVACVVSNSIYVKDVWVIKSVPLMLTAICYVLLHV